MLRAGLDLDGKLLALACASHSGEPFHLDGVREILAGAGLDESALQTPPDYPVDEVEKLAYVARGGQPAAVAMNCSGKHAAMLATCVHNGWPTTSYRDPAHPLQQAVREAIEDLAAERVSATGVDGCGAPVFGLTLAGLARAFRAIALAGDGTAEQRVAASIRSHPEWLGGTRRDVTRLIEGVPGLIAKDGAEGVYAAALPDGRAVALKIEDGGQRARPPRHGRGPGPARRRCAGARRAELRPTAGWRRAGGRRALRGLVTAPGTLQRRLGLADAVVIGLGSMLGTGVFVVWSPAAERAGQWLLVALGVAALVAYCNATSTAQLAAVHPESGGAYVYGRLRLGRWWGTLAGTAFVIGKTASCAAAALAIGLYAWPGHARWVAVAVVLVATAVNLAGITRTAGVTRVLVGIVLAVLAVAVVTALASRRFLRRPGRVRPDRRRSGRRACRCRGVVLRVRGLRPGGDAGRRGARPGSHHPEGGGDRSGRGPCRLPGRRSHPARDAGRRRVGADHDTAVRSRRRGRGRRTSRAGGSGARRVCRPPATARRREPHRPRDGDVRRPARPHSQRCRAVTPSRTAPR